MAPENELLSPWREELRQQANQGSTAGREEELEGGGKEQERETEMFDENSNVEKTITDSESEEQFRASLRREKKTGKRRGSVAVKMEEGMTVPGNIPVDLLRRISPLFEKLGLSMRQQLAMTMGFAELCGELKHMGCFSRHINIMSHSVLNSLYTGVDSTQLEMSLSTAWRHRRSDAEHLAATEISSCMEAVQELGTRILVQFDVVLNYLLEKLRRSLCYAGNIITPLQEPSIWTIIFFKVSTLKPLPHWRKRPCKPATGRTALTPVTWSRGTWPPTRPRWWWAPALQHLPNETLTGINMIP